MREIEGKNRQRSPVRLGVAAAALLMLLPAVPAFTWQGTQSAVEPQLAAAVRTHVEEYIRGDARLKGGFFLKDTELDQVRQLVFDHVHDGVEHGDDDRMVVCVDFVDAAGDRLDIDFALSGARPDELQVTGLRIHKVNGVERQQ